MKYAKLIPILIVFILLFGCTIINEKQGTKDSNNQSNVYANSSELAKSGDIVEVHYMGKLKDGNVFDSSYGKEPMQFQIDNSKIIKGFNDAVKGMKIGDKKTITLQPEEGYGERDKNMIIVVQKEQINNFNSLNVGDELKEQSGKKGIVIKINDSNAVIDFNHKLAGKVLVFDIELIKIRSEKK